MSSTDDAAPVARRFQVKGRVQMVGFRAWMVEQASQLALEGWVRNRVDGSVEAIVAGPLAAVEELIARCHSGPPMSRVDSVAVEATAEKVGPGFSEKPTT